MFTRQQRKGIEKLVEDGFNDAEISKRLGIDNPQELSAYRKSKRLMTPSERKARRNIIGGVVGTGALLATGGLIYELARPVTFEDARRNPELRQEYINQLVEREFGKTAFQYVHQFVYDYDKSLTVRTINDETIKYSQEQLFLENAIDAYINHPLFKDYNGKERRKKVLEFLQSPSGRPTLQNTVEFIRQGRLRNLEVKLAGSVGYMYDLGLKKKSKLFIYDGVFKPSYRNVSGTERIFEPTEENLIAILKHELSHAEDYYRGLHLQNGFAVTHDNFTKIKNDVSFYIYESKAYLRALEFTRALGVDHHTHQFALTDFAANMARVEKDLRSAKLDTYNQTLVGIQQGNLKEAIKNYPGLADMFKVFGVRLDLTYKN